MKRVTWINLTSDEDGYWAWRSWAEDGGQIGSQEDCPSLEWAMAEILKWHSQGGTGEEVKSAKPKKAMARSKPRSRADRRPA